MFLFHDFKCKAVIDLNTAEILGYIKDVEIDCSSGNIQAIIIPKKLRFKKSSDYIIPWDNIIKIGKKIIIVNR